MLDKNLIKEEIDNLSNKVRGNKKISTLFTQEGDWRSSILHNKNRYWNGVAAIKKGDKIIKKTVFADWYSSRGKYR